MRPLVAAAALRVVKHAPRRRDDQESRDDEYVAQKMERPEVRIGLPTEQHLQQMPRVVGEPVDVRVAGLQPTRQEVDRQWKAVHLGEQRHEKCAERSERSPIARGQRLEERESEHDEDNGVDQHQPPQAIG